MKLKNFKFDFESTESPVTSILLNPLESCLAWSHVPSVNHCFLREVFLSWISTPHFLAPFLPQLPVLLTSLKTGILQGAVLPFFLLSAFLTL